MFTVDLAYLECVKDSTICEFKKLIGVVWFALLEATEC